MKKNLKNVHYRVFIFSFLFFIFCWSASFSIWLYLIDSPVLRKESKKNGMKLFAVAIRDSVPFYQKEVTRIFVNNYLNQLYDTVIYLEQHSFFDKQKELPEAIAMAARQSDQVHLYLLSHGGKPYVYWIKNHFANKLKNLELVYHSGCGSTEEAELWKKTGAKTYIAHKGKKSLSPIFLVYFLRRFTRAYPLRRAVQTANRQTEMILKRTAEKGWFNINDPAFESIAYIFRNE